MNRKKERTTVLTLRLSEAEKQKVVSLAAQNDEPMSQTVRRLLNNINLQLS